MNPVDSPITCLEISMTSSIDGEIIHNINSHLVNEIAEKLEGILQRRELEAQV